MTAVEYDQNIASVYAALFPDDKLIVDDAHEYLRKNYKRFDFIWSSPPCQTHSSFRFNIGVNLRGVEPKYPDMTLYEEILFLQYHSNSLWVVENVVPYYPPMLNPVKRNRHLYWANFHIPEIPKLVENLRGKSKISELEDMHGFDLSAHRIPNKRQVLRNCVDPMTGLKILEAAQIAQDSDDRLF